MLPKLSQVVHAQLLYLCYNHSRVVQSAPSLSLWRSVRPEDTVRKDEKISQKLPTMYVRTWCAILAAVRVYMCKACAASKRSVAVFGSYELTLHWSWYEIGESTRFNGTRYAFFLVERRRSEKRKIPSPQPI